MDEPKQLTFVSDTDDGPPSVQEMMQQFETYIGGIDKKFEKVLTHQESTYMQGVLRFIKFKEAELNQVIETVKDKNSHLTEKDHQIISLKKTIVSLRRDVFEADQKRIAQMTKLKEVREIYTNVMKDKQFYLTKI